jgi:hypothetical protein
MGEPLNELWRLLGLKPGEDYLPDRNPPLLTDAGASKIREAERNPPTPDVAEWFRKANAAALRAWKANPSAN